MDHWFGYIYIVLYFVTRMLYFNKNGTVLCCCFVVQVHVEVRGKKLPVVYNSVLYENFKTLNNNTSPLYFTNILFYKHQSN